MVLTPPASDAAPLRLAIEATRGAAIAAHAAAGLARGQAQALRLLRAAEGLCRGAVATLRAAEVAKKKGGSVGKGKEDKDKGTGDNLAGTTEPALPPAQRGRRRWRRPRSRAAGTCAAVELDDDGWADEATVAPRLPDVVAGHSVGDRAAGPRRPLEARRGSRSPRRAVEAVSVASAGASPELLGGRIAIVRTLVSRPELSTSLVELLAYDVQAGRWLCRTPGGERLRLLPAKLTPTAEAGQKFLRRRWAASASECTVNTQ